MNRNINCLNIWNARDDYKMVYNWLEEDSNFPYSKRIEVKNFIKKKISNMLYDDAYIYYEEKNYKKSINRCENAIEDDYMIDDVKLSCKKLLIDSYIKQGNLDKENHQYSAAIDYYEKTLNLRNSDYRLKDYSCDFQYLKRDLVSCYIYFAKESWDNNDEGKMEKAINYINRAKKYDDELFKIKSPLSVLNAEIVPIIWYYFHIYYYLHKAKSESDNSKRSNYIYQA